MAKNKIKFAAKRISAAINPNAGYRLQIVEQSRVDADEIIEEVIEEKGLPLKPELIKFVFKQGLGDTAQLLWKDGEGAECAIDLTVTVGDYDHIEFTWPESVTDLAPGTKLTVKIDSRAGIDGCEPTTNEKTVTVVA